jgi:hypothetical protein
MPYLPLRKYGVGIKVTVACLMTFSFNKFLVAFIEDNFNNELLRLGKDKFRFGTITRPMIIIFTAGG